MVNKVIKPFIKWAGGKGQLIEQIRTFYPLDLGKKIMKYAEPFVGGGAVLFDILNKYHLDEIYISDINAELIYTYKTIRDNVDELVSLLSKYQEEFIPLSDEDRKKYYYEKRNRFNDLKIRSSLNVEVAVLFIFLNKTCYNGLYRVNSRGMFNVPMGAYKNPQICDNNNLTNLSKALKNVSIVCGDYSQSYDFIDNKTFVYFDPPYRPLNVTSNFNSYAEQVFNDSEQERLAEYILRLSDKGAIIVASNSDPKNANENDNFFDDLYSKLNINRILANRMINSNATLRGKINELLISNVKG